MHGLSEKLFVQRAESHGGHMYFVDYLRIFACVFVVTEHLSMYQAERFQYLPFEAIYKSMTLGAVSIFLCVSGYMAMLCYLNADIHYGAFIRKRFNRILLPCFSVSAVIIISRILLERFNLIDLSVKQYTPLDARRIVMDFLFAGASMHLYYLPNVFVMYALFPFLRKVVRNLNACLAITIVYAVALKPVLMGLYELTGLSLPHPDVVVHTFWGFQYFLLGCVLFHLSKYLDLFKGLTGVACFVIGAAVALRLSSGAAVDFLLVGAYVCLAKGLEGYRPAMLPKLAGLTYGIYLFHLPFFVKAGDVLLRRFELNWLSFLFVSGILLAGGCVLTWFLRLDPTLKFLFLGEEDKSSRERAPAMSKASRRSRSKKAKFVHPQ
jgi:peptidoglycan/LPS O-acetylase OafA/YrhL